ncbi:DUF2778 domain-containing protein [Methylobacterium sp. J-068]|uniref:DUF2778 domain-containing protein n=1 Tax=Methylobacterium sp. J-068 TaxID=2836649 RepID=UPI001FBABA6C|nr:DUF2778 domain-containing protein [Methylobacterium sp. J-068]MCJ2037058.1 DUF2778 domain-containing protein [Methylobacterium sp. J-068]
MAVTMDADTHELTTGRARRPGRGVLAAALILGGGLLYTAVTGITPWSRPPAPLPSPTPLDAAAATSRAAGSEASESAAPSEMAATAPDVAATPPDESPGAERAEAPVSPSETATYAAAPDPAVPADAPPPSAPAPAVLASRLVPLPVPRPPEFRSGRSAATDYRAVARRAPRVSAAPPPPEDDRSFVEKLFGIERAEPPRLAYAALETKPVENVFRRALNVVPGGGVAVYDIRAKVVTLPNGEKLEAHSGLGASMDDPGHVHVRMKGPTPVGTYDISEREQPFHGVRALRLHPVGGPEAVHGRVGLLAHTYMLGASGASNGCVSFKDYDKFLQAYLRGEIQRLVVVAGG